MPPFTRRTLLSLATIAITPLAHADILRWDNNQVIPASIGITPGPGVDLSTNSIPPHDFQFADLQNLNLTSASFRASNFANATFHASTLTNAAFLYADISNANLSGANLTNANFQGTKVTNADFTSAVIKGALFFDSAAFTRAQLESTASHASGNLQNIQIYFSDFSGLSIAGKDLSGTKIYQATLTGLNAAGANLFSASLEQSPLVNANFAGANLTNAYLSGANLTNADFTGANLAHAQFFAGTEPVTSIVRSIDPVGTPTTLSGASFKNAALNGVSLYQATLTNADFTNAAIRGTSFAGATGFTRAQFESTTNFATHDLAAINLQGIVMKGWNFSRLYLPYASFANFVTHTSNGQEVNTIYTPHVTFTNLSGANFEGACLKGASLVGANLAGANLQGADLTNTLQANTILRAADLRGAISWNPDATTNLTNTIRPDGTVNGLHIQNGETFLVRNALIPITVKTAATMTSAATVAFRLEDNFTPVHFVSSVMPELAGTLDLSLAPNIDPTTLIGHTFTLFAWSQLPTAHFASITTPTNLTWDTSSLYTTGTITLTAATSSTPIPEPTTLTLLIPAAMLFLSRRRP